MRPHADRIRQILSDAGSAVRRASEPPPPPPAEPNPARERLLERLRELKAGARPPDAARVETGPETASADAGGRRGAVATPPFPTRLSLPEEDGRTLEERVGGTLRRGPKGSFHEVVRRYPLDGVHGDVPLCDLLGTPLPLRARERRSGGGTHVRPEDAAYLDVETTGLAGGTGTVAFLVGVGRIEGDAFVVRQYFLRDFPDEPPALEALAEDLRDSPLVTFNGRSFDWPLLSTRFRLHRIAVADRDHVDLLPVARRLWAGSLASHALSELERRVLGVERDDDLPGALVPAAYFAWLREARSAGVALAFRHNEIDVVSMAALGAVAARMGRDPDAHPALHPGDALGRAQLLLQQGDEPRARAVLAAAAQGRVEAAPRRLLHLLGRLLRRAGDDDAAVALWTRRLEAGLPFDPLPVEEAAKILEHRRRDPRAALAIVERALEACPSPDPRRDALAHRAERLRRKASRRRPS